MSLFVPFQHTSSSTNLSPSSSQAELAANKCSLSPLILFFAFFSSAKSALFSMLVAQQISATILIASQPGNLPHDSSHYQPSCLRRYASTSPSIFAITASIASFTFPKAIRSSYACPRGMVAFIHITSFNFYLCRPAPCF